MQVAEKQKRTRKKSARGLLPEMVFCFAAGTEVNKEFCFNNSSVLPKNTRYCAPNNCTSPYRKCRACTQQGVNGSDSKVYNAESGLCYVHHDQGADFDKKAAVGSDEGDDIDWKAIAERSGNKDNLLARAAAILSTKPEKEPIVAPEGLAEKTAADINAVNAVSGKSYLVEEMPIELIVPNPRQPRKYFSETALQELQQSMKAEGQKIEIRVVPIAGGLFMIKEGESRWISAKQNSEKTVKAIVDPYLGEEQLLIDSFVCNFGRKGHEPFEVALALQDWRKMSSMKDLDEDEFLLKAAKKIGKGRSLKWVKDHYSLLELPPELFKRLHPDTPERERLLFTAALLLVQKHVPAEKRKSLGLEIINKGMTGRVAKMHIHKKIGGNQKLRRGRPSDDAAIFQSFVNSTSEKTDFLLALGSRRLEAMFKNKLGEYQREITDAFISCIERQEELLEMMGGTRRRRETHPRNESKKK